MRQDARNHGIIVSASAEPLQVAGFSKQIEERGVVKIELTVVNNANIVAKLIDPDYEELTASEYCLRCTDSYKSHLGRYKCRRTGKIVISTDGRATVNAMKCT